MSSARDPSPWIMLGALLCVVVVVVFASAQIAGLDGRIAAMAQVPAEDDIMQTLTTSVTLPDGLVTIVKTDREDSDADDAAFVKRHNDLVAAVVAAG